MRFGQLFCRCAVSCSVGFTASWKRVTVSFDVGEDIVFQMGNRGMQCADMP
jgi:hypothetical protein